MKSGIPSPPPTWVQQLSPSGIPEITGPVPDGMHLMRDSVESSTTDNRVRVVYQDEDGTFHGHAWLLAKSGAAAWDNDVTAVRWTIAQPFEPGASIKLSYHVHVDGNDSLVPACSGNEIGIDTVSGSTRRCVTQRRSADATRKPAGPMDPVHAWRGRRDSSGLWLRRVCLSVCAITHDDFELFQAQWDVYSRHAPTADSVSPTTAWRLEWGTLRTLLQR